MPPLAKTPDAKNLDKLKRPKRKPKSFSARVKERFEKKAESATRQIKLFLPRLRPDQWQIVQHPAKRKTLAMGRRWGKSVLAQCVAIPTALAGGRVAWCVPTYKNGRPLWRLVQRVLGPLKKAGLVRINSSERTVEFPNGGLLALYSMDNPDSIRGESFHLVIIDEAAMVSEEAWQDCIQPTLADYDGDCIIISTPKGRNWFFREFQRGLQEMAQAAEEGRDATVAAFTAPTANNPNPNIRKAAELAGQQLPERTYRQEWLAQFLEDGGTVFRYVARATTGKRLDVYEGAFVIGLDWGRDNDYTVAVVRDAKTGRVVDWERFNQIGWSLQRGRLLNLCRKWNALLVLAEENSIGQPNIEILQAEGLPVLGFNTNSATKNPLVESYTLSLEREEIDLPDDDTFRAEHEAFEGEKSKATGRMIYSAPEGSHDDTVIASALSDWARVNLFSLLALLEGEERVTHHKPVSISPV